MSFSKSFLWGTTSAAYQIEGAHNEDGKGPGIWDELSDGHVRHGENGNTACDHYHRFREDVVLMKQMGIRAYCFSVSWPRIMPEEDKINEKGLQFYKNLVQELLAAEITPICTLYHWNLPIWLHEKGGWLCDKITAYFAAFTEVVVAALSDKVSIWMTLSGAATFMGNGYLKGDHAPFEISPDEAVEKFERISMLTRNILLAHGKAVQMIRRNAVLPPQIGIAVDGMLLMPWTETQEEIAKARAATFSRDADYHLVNWWLDPIVKGEVHQQLAEAIIESDLKEIYQPLDFIGYSCFKADNYEDDNGRNDAVYPGLPRTATDWPITPEVLYWATRFFHERYRLPVLISENGMANIDFIMSDERIHDQQRIEYLKGYLKGLKRAVSEGYPVMGYLYGSFLDKFEWTEGYSKRFGLVYVDYRTGKRIPKDSALWYTKTIRENGRAI